MAGLGAVDQPVMVTAGLCVLMAIGSRRMRTSWKTLALSWVLASAAVSAGVDLDMIMAR